jgi:DNA-nicking Smr family endonuclease
VNGEGGRKGPGDSDDKCPDDDAPSFAELLGDAKPIDRGPTRLAPPTPGRARIKRPPGSGNAVNAGKTFRWPDPSDRHRAAAEGVTDLQLAALERGDPEPRERIDLHGTRLDAAGRLLAKRLESARSQGLDCVIVIHGRGQRSASGEAVLRDALPGWLTKGKIAHQVLAFAPAPDRLGGRGATLVLLRRS